MIVDELVTLLEFDADVKPADIFGKALEKIEDLSKKVALGITGAVTSVGFFADKVAKEVSDNYEWAKSVGIATESYQRLSHVAKIMGGDLDSIKGDLESWVRSAKASGKSLEEIFLSESKAIQGMSADQAHAMLSARGYSETAIRMLQLGENKLKSYLSQAEVIPESNLRSATEYARTWNEVVSTTMSTLQSAVASALPAVKEILDGVKEFVQQNRELVKTGVSAFFKGVANSLVRMYDRLLPVIDGFYKLLDLMGMYTKDADAVEKVTQAMNTAMGLLAVTIGVRLVTSLAKVVWAFGTLMKGVHKGYQVITVIVIPRIVKMLKKTWHFIPMIVPWIKGTLIPSIVATTKAIAGMSVAFLTNPVVGIIAGIIALVVALSASIYYVVNNWEEVKQAVREVYEGTMAYVHEAGEALKSMLNSVLESVMEVKDGILAYVSEWYEALTDFLGRVIATANGLWDRITGRIAGFWNWVMDSSRRALRQIADFFVRIFMAPINWAKETLQGFLDSAISTINTIIETANKIPGIDIDKLNRIKLEFGSKPKENAIIPEIIGIEKPAGTIPTGMLQGMTSNVTSKTSNFSNSTNYYDNRKITINTTSTTGAGVIKELKKTPAPVGAGMGMAGAF